MRALARIFGVLPTVRYHLVDVQPGLFADSTAGASVSRAAPGTSTGRAAPASCESDPAATPVARAASGVSRMLGHQRLHSESLGSEFAGPALPLHPHPDFLAKVSCPRSHTRSLLSYSPCASRIRCGPALSGARVTCSVPREGGSSSGVTGASRPTTGSERDSHRTHCA